MPPSTRSALRRAIAATVRELRERQGLSLDQLALRADLDVDDLRDLEAARPSRVGDDLIEHYLRSRFADLSGNG